MKIEVLLGKPFWKYRDPIGSPEAVILFTA
jgi:hypothetical protein